jgi:hypothetical protein
MPPFPPPDSRRGQRRWAGRWAERGGMSLGWLLDRALAWLDYKLGWMWHVP